MPESYEEVLAPVSGRNHRRAIGASTLSDMLYRPLVITTRSYRRRDTK
jgi:hypothetical protein